MKFKIMLLALPFMALSTLFTFCAKEQDSTTVKEETNTIKEATDRGGPCDIVLSSTSAASICGTTNGTGSCTNCSGAAYAGFAFFGGIDTAPTHTFGSSMTDGTAAITNVSTGKNLITVTVNGVVVQQVQLQPGECRSTSFTSDPCNFVIN